MPIVPGGAGPDSYAIPTGAINARQQTLDPAAGTQGTQALAGLGEKIQGAEQQTSDTVLKIQHMNNVSKSNDITNQVSQKNDALLYGPGGFYSKSGKDAIEAYPQVLEQLQANRQWGMQQAGNQDAQQMVQQGTDYLLNREMNSMGMHYAEQSKQYSLNTTQATYEQAVNTASLNYDNPQAVTSAFHTAIDAANQIGALQGSSPDSLKAMQLDFTSKAAAQILDGAMAKNPSRAAVLLKQFSSEGLMDAPTLLRYQDQIDKSGLAMDASSGATAVLGGGYQSPGPSGTTQAPVNNPGNLRVPGSPNKFEQYPTIQDGLNALDHQLVLYGTPKAQGGHGLTTISQVISTYAPSSENNTAAYIADVSKSTGIAPDAPIDLVNNAQLRSQIAAAIVKHEGNASMLSAGGAQQIQIDQIGANLDKLADQNGAAMQAKYPGQPDAYQRGQEAVYTGFARMKSSFDAQVSANTDLVSQAIDANKIDSPSDLINLGATYANAYNNLPPDKQKDMDARMQKNAPGMSTQWSPEADKAIAYYRGLAVTNPKAFVAVDFDSPAILNLIPKDDRTPLIQQQQAILKGVYAGPKPSDVSDAVKLVTPILNSAGIYSGDSPAWLSGATGASDRQQNEQLYTQVVGQLTQDITAFQKQNERLPRPDELQKMAQQLILKGTVNGTHEMLFQAEQGGKIPTNFLPDIPTADLAAINRQYYASYGRYPDQATAARLYLSSQVSQGNTPDFLQQPPVPGADVASSLPGGLNFETRSAPPTRQTPSNRNGRPFGAGLH